MCKITKYTCVFALTAALILVPFGLQVFAEDAAAKQTEITSEKMAADLILVRPVGIFATLLGGAVFIIASPFSAAGGNIKDSYEKLVVAPARYTFKRPLGDI